MGAENIVVMPYEYFVEKPQEFYSKLFKKIGIQQSIDVGRLPRINPGVTQKALEIQRFCNSLLQADEQALFRNFLEQNFQRKIGEELNLFSPERREDLLAYYKESNSRLFEEFMAEMREYDYSV